MAELTKFINIITKVVRQVVREELEYTKKQILSEMQGVNNNSHTMRENINQAPTNIPKMFTQFGTPNTKSDIIVGVAEPKKLNISLLQQLANDKMQNPDEAFLSMKM